MRITVRVIPQILRQQVAACLVDVVERVFVILCLIRFCMDDFRQKAVEVQSLKLTALQCDQV